MNKFLIISAITLCLVAPSALGQYQTAPAYSSGYQQQRKMAPTPQSYQQGGQQKQMGGYGGGAGERMPMAMMMQQQEKSMDGYEQQQQQSMEGDYGNKGGASKGAPMQMAGGQSGGYGAQGAKSGGYGGQGAQSGGYGGKQMAKQYEEPQHPPMPFQWGYDINDGYGTTQYHKENGDEYGKRTGSYGYMDAYGVYRNVYYVADENGFRATVKTNEPGTANESPADVELHAEEPPANVNPGNKDSSSYGSSSSYNSNSDSSSSYGSNSGSAGKQSSGSYGSSSSEMMGPSKSYGEAQSSAQSSYGSGASEMMSMPNGGESKSYGGMGMGKQQSYGMATGGRMAGNKQSYGAGQMMGGAGQSSYGASQQMMNGGSQYGGSSPGGSYGQSQSNNKGSSRRYSSGTAKMMGAKQYESMEGDSMMSQQYGQKQKSMGQQEYGNQSPMKSAAGGYGAAMQQQDELSAQYGMSDAALAQQYGPSMMNSNNPAQMQYGGQGAMDGASTYASTRLMKGAQEGSSYGRSNSQDMIMPASMMAKMAQADYGMSSGRGASMDSGMSGYGTKSSGAGSNSMNYKRAAARSIGALAKRY